MKKSASLLLICCLLSLPGFAQRLKKDEARSLSYKLLRQYSPDSYHLLKTMADAPTKLKTGSSSISFGEATDFMVWVEQKDKESLISSLETAVHETNHGYTFRMGVFLKEKDTEEDADGWGFASLNNQEAYYIDPEQTIVVEKTEVYRTKEMNEVIPERFKTFRYKTYVYPSSGIGAQKDGAYGLMDEWNSYYHGTRTSFDFYPYFEARAGRDFSVWQQYVQNVAGTYYAHLEFKYYILEYLLYAKENYPEVYEGILNNAQFRLAFRTIDSRFTKLTEDWFAQIDQIIAAGKEQGKNVRIDGEYFWIDGSGVGIFSEHWEVLTEALSDPKYQPLLADLQE